MKYIDLDAEASIERVINLLAREQRALELVMCVPLLGILTTVEMLLINCINSAILIAIFYIVYIF